MVEYGLIQPTVAFNPLEARTWQMATLLASYTRHVSTLFQSMWVAAYHYETQSLTILSSTQDCYVDCMIQAFPQMVRTICRIPQMVWDRLRNSANGPGPFAEFRKRSRTVYRILQTVPDRLQNSGGSSDKNTFFGGFLQVLCAVFYFFMDNLYMKCLFCKKNRSI